MLTWRSVDLALLCLLFIHTGWEAAQAKVSRQAITGEILQQISQMSGLSHAQLPDSLREQLKSLSDKELLLYLPADSPLIETMGVDREAFEATFGRHYEDDVKVAAGGWNSGGGGDGVICFPNAQDQLEFRRWRRLPKKNDPESAKIWSQLKSKATVQTFERWQIIHSLGRGEHNPTLYDPGVHPREPRGGWTKQSITDDLMSLVRVYAPAYHRFLAQTGLLVSQQVPGGWLSDFEDNPLELEREADRCSRVQLAIRYTLSAQGGGWPLTLILYNSELVSLLDSVDLAILDFHERNYLIRREMWSVDASKRFSSQNSYVLTARMFSSKDMLPLLQTNNHTASADFRHMIQSSLGDYILLLSKDRGSLAKDQVKSPLATVIADNRRALQDSVKFVRGQLRACHNFPQVQETLLSHPYVEESSAQKSSTVRSLIQSSRLNELADSLEINSPLTTGRRKASDFYRLLMRVEQSCQRYVHEAAKPLSELSCAATPHQAYMYLSFVWINEIFASGYRKYTSLEGTVFSDTAFNPELLVTPLDPTRKDIELRWEVQYRYCAALLDRTAVLGLNHPRYPLFFNALHHCKTEVPGFVGHLRRVSRLFNEDFLTQLEASAPLLALRMKAQRNLLAMDSAPLTCH